MIVLPQSSDRHPVRCLAFSPDGLSLACAARKDAGVVTWDLLARQPRGTMDAAFGSVTSVAFSPDGETLACANSAGSLWLWSSLDPTDVRREKSHRDGGAHAPAYVAFSPDGRTVATNLASLQRRSDRHGVSLVRLGQSRVVHLPTGGMEPTCLAWSPDGTRLAVGSYDRNVTLLDVEARTRVATFFQGQKVHYVAFSPDGRTLAAGNPQGLVKLWDVATCRKLLTLKGQATPLRALCYSPDGGVIVTAGGEGIVTFWDVKTGKSRTAFDWAVGEVSSVCFAPDGMRAAAGGMGRVVIWDVDGWEVG